MGAVVSVANSVAARGGNSVYRVTKHHMARVGTSCAEGELQAAGQKSTLTDERRAMYERMAHEIAEWKAGRGPKPRALYLGPE